MNNNHTNVPDDKIINRLKKMLALGECMGTTEHERDTAMSQAYKLMAKYNLQRSDIEKTEAPEPRDTYKQAGWSMVWCREVFAAVADLFFCQYFYNNNSGKINATKCFHSFVGRESNAKTAMLIGDFLVVNILKEGRTRFGDNLCSETRNFGLGAASKLRTRIRKLKQEASQPTAEAYTGGTALVLTNLYEAEAKANIALLPKLKVGRGSKVTDYDSYGQGREYGDTLSLNVQVKGKTSIKIQ